MIDARHYSVPDELRDGLAIQIRSLRPDDVDRMAEAFAKLSEDSIRLRFFGHRSGLTDADRRLIRELDFDSRVVLVVTRIENGREIIIASGSYSRIGTNAAEVAFVVEEDYHGQGIARRLLRHLGGIAIERGIVRFEAEVLPENAAMLRVFAAGGWPVTSKHEDGVVCVSLDLANPVQVRDKL